MNVAGHLALDLIVEGGKERQTEGQIRRETNTVFVVYELT